MGSKQQTAGARPCASRCIPPDVRSLTLRAGFSNATLAGMIGILALVGALAMIQSGQLDIGALAAQPAPAVSDSKKAKKGKPPVLFSREEVTAIPAAPADTRAGKPPVYRHQPRRELYQALARMDGEAAAEMLSEIDAEQVTELLLELRERDLARILEAAVPLDAGRWVTDLLEAAPQLELPEDLSALAMDAAGADSMLDMEPPAPDSGSEDPASVTNEETTEAAEDEAVAPADPAEVPGNNGAVAEREFPSRPPDTNTA